MNQELKISRLKLIATCEQFLKEEIGIKELEEFALDAIINDNLELEDEVVSDIILQWDNQYMDFPITMKNMELWIHQLKTDENLLADHNLWNNHIDRQKEVCKKFDSKWNPINKKLKIGASADLHTDPINGLRHTGEKGTTGWYIWTGEYSDSKDFFEPLCAEHLLQIRPQLIQYLGLDVGFRILVDSKGNEDIWFDEKLMNSK